MIGSEDSLECCMGLPITEKNAVPLNCWQDICLSNIWIPAQLLPSRSKCNNNQATQGIYHTLQKKDLSKYIASFSVYISPNDDDDEQEIFHSESDEDMFGSSATSFERIETLLDNTAANVVSPLNSTCSNVVENYVETNNLNENFVKKEHEKEFKDEEMLMERSKDNDSHVSISEIIDATPEINIKDFTFDLKQHGKLTELSSQDKPNLNSKKSKKNKVKKKVSKSLTLDQFLEGGVELSQDYYCEKYFQSITREQNKNALFGSIPIRSKVEFPDLVTEEVKFIHSDKTEGKSVGPSYKCFQSDFSNFGEIKENSDDADEVKSSVIEKSGRIIIENIPLNVSKDDIFSLLCGYGEIKDFSMISAGKFFKAYVEFDLICDIDWIVECLDGSDLFGAPSEVLKCYQQ